jgi:hypothetical protein
MYWQERIMNGANQTDHSNISNKVLMKLTTRWAFGNKSYKISDIKKDLKDYPGFLDWVLSADKVDVVKQQKENMKPFENLIAAVGAEILMNASGFLAANPDAAVQSIRKEVANKVYKLTGLFAPINQITGLLKFGR